MKVRSTVAVFGWVLVGGLVYAQSNPAASFPTTPSSKAEDPLLRVLVSKKIITTEEAAAVASATTADGQRQKLTELLIAKGVLTKEEGAGILGVKAEPVLLASTTP